MFKSVKINEEGVGDVRIIAGSARGTKLDTIEGLDTRPTTDRVKENIFNIVQFEIMGERVLDLFAGSGALGLEAASRGADQVVLVEASPKCAVVTQKNIDKSNLKGKVKLILKPVENALKSLKTEDVFHVVFMDPPYDKGFVIPTIESIDALGLVDDSGMIVVEHNSKTQYPDVIGGFELGKFKKYGSTAVSIYRRTT